MEILLLSFLGITIQCEPSWEVTGSMVRIAALLRHFNSPKSANMTTIVFVGMCIGAPVWGWLADRLGRKKAFLASNVILFLFGVLSAFSVNYYMLLVSLLSTSRFSF